MTEEEMWAAFIAARPELKNKPHDAWRYGGDDPDLLAELTLNGVKTATAGALRMYEHEGEAIPKAGDFSVVLDSLDSAVCIIETTRVVTVPFKSVAADHARKEGEGDGSLAYWREVHERFFRGELAETGEKFSADTPVVCEEFRTVYPVEKP